MVELIPFDNHKSFYGKAKMQKTLDGISLFSYGTQVCLITNDGEFRRLWLGYSATTMRHINSFLRTNGYEGMSKKEWERIPVQN